MAQGEVQGTEKLQQMLNQAGQELLQFKEKHTDAFLY